MAKKKTSKNKNRVDKPWGYYEDFYRGDEVVFKRIVVDPDENISYQVHKERDEFWYIAEGSAALIIKNEVADVINAEERSYGMNGFYIKRMWPHGIKNVGTKPLVIYEMQFGKPDEDDIVRLKDKYGRADKVEETELENVTIVDNTKETNDGRKTEE